MSLNAIATNRFFKGLKCPYTGKPVTVRVVAHGSHTPMYFSPDAYDPTMPHKSAADLLQKVSTRNGIIGAVAKDKERVCAYTGHEMALTATGNMFSFVGGFSPATLHKDPYAFARMLHTRNGVLVGKEKDFVKPSVEATSREPGEAAPKDVTAPSDEAQQEVEDLLKKDFKRSTTITIPPGTPAKKGK